MSENNEIEVNDVISWADGILGAIGTEYARNVTEEELEIATAIMDRVAMSPTNLSKAILEITLNGGEIYLV